MLSIITINYNNDEGLHRTIKSVQKQIIGFDFEHIIIDGKSTDYSMVVAEKYSSVEKNVILISERDHGIYDAMNKGLKIASGSHVAFLNAGDVLAYNGVLNNICSALKYDSSLDFVYGDLCFVDSKSKVTREWISGEYCKSKLYYGWMPPHPMTTIRKTILNDCGDFDEKFQISADYDLMLRILLRPGLVIKYLSDTFVHMELGGISTGSFKGIIRSNVEVLKSWFKYRRYALPFWIFFTKPLSKLIQKRRFKLR